METETLNTFVITFPTAEQLMYAIAYGLIAWVIISMVLYYRGTVRGERQTDRAYMDMSNRQYRRIKRERK